MRILFDQGTTAPLRDHLSEHSVDTAFERGWSNLRNGALLDRAEADGYQILITTGPEPPLPAGPRPQTARRGRPAGCVMAAYPTAHR